MKENTILLKDIHKKFGSVYALRGVTMEISPGSVTAVVGDNGSGKSTMVKLLSGNLRPDSGSITVKGVSYPFLTVKQSLDLGISTVYQDLSLDNYKNSAENIFLGSELTKGPFLDKKAMHKYCRELLERLRINIDDLSVPAGMLSGGQRQGLAIARALRTKSDLLILDEPTAAMGIQESRSTLNILRQLKEQGITELIISHNLFQVFDIADRVFVMRAGKCIADIYTKNTSAADIQELILDRENKEACK